MQIVTGTVVDGKVVVEGVDLDEGSIVAVLTRGEREPFALSSEDEDELLSAIAEIERGDVVSLEQLAIDLKTV